MLCCCHCKRSAERSPAQEWLPIFELNSTAREKLMVSLLGAFDSRTWVNISGILLRLVRGGGFGQVRRRTSITGCVLPLVDSSIRTRNCRPWVMAILAETHDFSSPFDTAAHGMLSTESDMVVSAPAQLSPQSMEGSSLLFRSLLREASVEHAPVFEAFLNRLFNTLNWTVTEFIVVLKVHKAVASVRKTCCCGHVTSDTG